MPQIRAIVFDANVFGKGALPNTTTIALWADACAEHDAELWIPEIVVHELAQHAVEAHDKFRDSYDAHSRVVAKWGVEPDPPMTSIEPADILAAIEVAGAVVVPLTSEDARKALLDQVLQTGAGERKSGVKTGASDSAWVRSVIAYNEGEPDGLIVVTGDTRALEETCTAIGVYTPQQAKNIGELLHLLDESEPANEQSTTLFATFVQDYFVDSAHGRRTGTPGAAVEDLADIDRSNWWDVPRLPDDGYEMWEEQEATVSTVQTAKVIGPIDHDRWSDSLSAQIEFEVEVEEQYARQDPSGYHVEYAAHSYTARVRGTVQAFLDGATLDFDGVLEDVELVPVSDGESDWQLI